MKQKFFRGQTVYVGDMPQYMSRFKNNFIGIIGGSYRDQYGGDDTKNFTIHYLSEHRHGLNNSSWYEEDQLTLLDDDSRLGEWIIQTYADEEGSE